MASQERWDIQKSVINGFAAELATGTDPRTRSTTASLMLQALSAFADSMVAFFNDGLAEKNGRRKLTHRNITPDYISSLISDQASHDLDAILRAYFQRAFAVSLASGQKSQSMLRQLEAADKLAFDMLKASMQAGVLATSATVFTYYQKSLRIRLLPYVRVAMIGMPYNAINDKTDYLALAHEVGHYIYRNSVLYDPPANDTDAASKNQLAPLHQQTAECNPWYSPWLEEIVADVFGCIIAGPKIAQCFQELSLGNPRNLLAVDDGHHPPPILRPLIYIDTLKALDNLWTGVDLEKTVEELETTWKDAVGAIIDDVDIRLPGSTNATLISVQEAREKIANDVIAMLLDPVGNQPKSGQLYGLVETLKPGSDGDYLFRQLWGPADKWGDPEILRDEEQSLQGRLTNVPLVNFAAKDPPPELNQDQSPDAISVDKPSDVEGIDTTPVPFGKTGTRFDKLIEDYSSNAGAAVPESKWIELLEFGGWIEQGPSGGTPH